MSDAREVVFNDVFDSFSMLVGSNFVNLYDVKIRVMRFSEALVDMIDLPSDRLDDSSYDWASRIHPEDREIYDTMMNELFALRRLNYDITCRISLKSGDYSVFRLIGGVIRDNDGHPSFIGGMMIPSGLTRQTDRVTSLKNMQALLDNMLYEDIYDEGTSLLMIGFGRMTHVNEVYGYGHGSRLLIRVSEIIDEILDGRGEIYRAEGSKFVITLMEIGNDEVSEIYESIRTRLRQGVEMEDGIVHNLFVYGGYMRLDEDVIADRTLYDCLLHAYSESKRYHQGDLVLYHGNHSENKNLTGTLSMIRDVRESLVHDFEGFFLQYEPIFAKPDSAPIGAEVHLKWQSDEYGVVDSESFLSEIEQDYVYERLSRWILRNAIRDGKDFLDANQDFKLFLTVTQSQLWMPYYVNDIVETATEMDFPLRQIHMHINKDCRFLATETICRFLESLRERGIPFGIDDFARGNAYLKTFSAVHPDYVRFSDELVDNLSVSSDDVTILTYLINMVAKCDTDVYIKGVDDKESLDKLTGLPVNGFQGKLFGGSVYYDEVLDYYDTENPDNQ